MVASAMFKVQNSDGLYRKEKLEKASELHVVRPAATRSGWRLRY